MRIDHFEERLRSWHVFHRVLERVCSTKVIAGFSLRMYTTLIPPYIFSSANEELFLDDDIFHRGLFRLMLL